MKNYINLGRMTTVVVLTIIAISASAGWLMAQADRMNEDANALAAHYKIGNRAPVITADDAEMRISHFPDFGEKTVEAIKKIAPVEKISALYGLKNASGRPLMTNKQIKLLLMFYQLKP